MISGGREGNEGGGRQAVSFSGPSLVTVYLSRLLEVFEMFNHRLFRFSFALALGASAASSAGVCFGQEQKRAVRNSVDEKKSESTSRYQWTHEDDDRRVRVTVDNKVVFADDYSDVREVAEDARLIIEDARKGESERRYRVEHGAGGALVRKYWVGGAERELDGEGREWVRRTLLEAVRRGGLHARERARAILRDGGPRALSEEISHLRGDHTLRIYFEELLGAPGLDEAALADALRGASRVAGDYERAQLLVRTADAFLTKERLVPAYFEAAARIKSDYELRRVLSNAVRRESLGAAALAAAVRAAAGIGSDYEKAAFLTQVARLNPRDERVRAAFAEVLGTISSDYERGRVERVMLRAGASN